MFKKAIIAGVAAAIAVLGAAGVAYADDNDSHATDFSADNGASHNIDTGHFLGFLSI
ncbi:MAG: hypothetical protein QOF38_523 [Pseudonocardiales bacterium]|jgi:hypothetical protein|nr:hypothetical protein [Pseudonocardiales bacterium]MDT7606667.1 hypothetical protein [Pseudonocardiales bacterium]MDT7620107.1 hypothetical protein [Pseudonocardiales bacterium]MDT7655808.1 hypothetical protein [Pseudonocardiales bacterium]MDT7667889.1 hypothetical protein [Pseudonocardiales bacterium]